ncbi:MAG: diaminopimelate epimerase [Candidatus Scalindua sp.]|nr:diaminopimelate epimerase [Candidatus Scalindua sp.]MBT5304117.1 diaminopimelate epimerase [Candidatus Scalindua sp.]MBT6048437.1 diaminopimelate epimerase [Candidatus Scalindua sp.]MBT6562358.1 diaminopimelate epimerase [Candidatus Scalindua sp.]MBT7211362.1 diaminopimelate epimerase [Candidatus Scalindua sp.]
MKFTKMHGIGNDYVYVNCFEENVKNPSELSIVISDRHFGIGSDGLILIMPSQVADAKMRIFNADGSEAQMCGNGIRCVAKYMYEYGLKKSDRMTIETGAGLKTIELTTKNGNVTQIRVEMGTPELLRNEIPMLGDNIQVINEPLQVNNTILNITCVSMGNPHCITFVDDIDSIDLNVTGKAIENHELFPERINAHFVQQISANKVKMRTWERGSGETLACGTGAVATGVACVLNNLTERIINTQLPGGELTVEWTDDTKTFMTGPAEIVFTGQWDEDRSP